MVHNFVFTTFATTVPGDLVLEYLPCGRKVLHSHLDWVFLKTLQMVCGAFLPGLQHHKFRPRKHGRFTMVDLSSACCMEFCCGGTISAISRHHHNVTGIPLKVTS